VSEPERPPNLNERIELLKLDYDRTAKVLESLNSNTMTARGFSITVTAGLLTVAVNRDSWFTAAIAAGVAVLFFAIDLYYSATFKRAFDHLEHVDEIFRARYESLGRRGSSDRLAELLDPDKPEKKHKQFGLQGAWGFDWSTRDWLTVPLRFALIAFYLTLFFGAVATIVYVSW
jgi:hypothetical protein